MNITEKEIIVNREEYKRLQKEAYFAQKVKELIEAIDEGKKVYIVKK